MRVTLLPSSLPAPCRGTGAAAAASSRTCASRLCLDPACAGTFASATAGPKDPKRPRSFCDDEPPTKRHCAGEDPAAARAMTSLEAKKGANRMLLSVLPPGRSSREVIPLPDSVVRVLQENGTRSCVRDYGDKEQIEIDVQALGNYTLRVIKDSVGAYLQGGARREATTPKQSKESVVKQSKPRSIPSKAASTKSIPPRAPTTSNLARTRPKTNPPKASSKSALFRPGPSLLAPPKLSDSGESLCELAKTAISRSPPRSTTPRRPSLRGARSPSRRLWPMLPRS